MKGFQTGITKEQARDTGMAMVLLALLLFLFAVPQRREIVYLAVILHVLNMTVPQVYRPVAVVWLGVSHILGMAVSTVTLSIVFFVIVTPTGLIRKLAGKDSLRLKEFKAGRGSAMVARNHIFSARDMENPY